jgi:ankyrin repeat protein
VFETCLLSLFSTYSRMGCGASAGGQLKLHSAIRWHSTDDDRMDQILANISSVNLFDQGNGNQALHLAAQNGKVELVELLIKNNAEIDGVNFQGNSKFVSSIKSFFSLLH